MPDETDRVSGVRRALDEFLDRLARAVVVGLPPPGPPTPPVVPPTPPEGDGP